MVAAPQWNQTPHGVDLYEAISALQKLIRRGTEREALLWAAELGEGPGYNAMASRLLVTAHEDIGLADMQTVTFVMLSIDQMGKWKKAENGAWRLTLANIVLAMCRATKSRESDHAQAATFGAIEDGKVPTVPDFALDKHTRRGKAKGRGVEHFLTEGAKLFPSQGPDPYAEEARLVWLRREAEAKDMKGRPKDSLF